MAANAGSESPPLEAASVIEFLLVCGQLKKTKRTGWVKSGIADCESVSDHMYRMGMISLVLGAELAPELRDRMVKMALVHDLAEAFVGDITPHCGVSAEEKHRMEHEAMHHIAFDVLKGSSVGREIYELWNEYEARETQCARFVMEIDKFEMIVQALEYERQHGKTLQDFFDSTANSFRTPVMQAWAEQVRSMRPTQPE
ncbi:HD domain-containing protein 2-like [Porphyridium purpureum]|uniref:5'-deoxynucleotidase n=1 Tax=Porphyridium purpureum TaxID=35688 RepID=A0A5J4YMV7_PORPP|nr:HD domain-containing protein 2-like [Porphyridium purpureum]|eukprot:POR8971..scf244_11